MIEVSHLSQNYGNRKAIDDLNFKVQKGEVVGFLGPNGAGKTTTMQIITGYRIPTSGTCKIDSLDVMEEPVRTKQKIGYLPETPPLYFDMYVTDYLSYVAGLKNCPKKDIPRLVDEVVAQTGLEEVKERLIQNLSKGFRQRVGLAQALVSRPEILILDEPTVGLDPKQVIEIRNLILSLKQKHTIILSTHILHEVEVTCDRVIIINQGKLVAQESLSGLIQKEQMKQNRRVQIKVKTLNEQLLKELKQVKGVEDVQKQKMPGEAKGVLLVVSGENTNELLAKKVIDSGAGFIELKESLGLEEAFVKLTSDAGEN